MRYVYCKSHLRPHSVNDEGSTEGVCSVIDKGEMPRTHEELDATERAEAYEEVIHRGWPLYPDANMDKVWDISGKLRKKRRHSGPDARSEVQPKGT